MPIPSADGPVRQLIFERRFQIWRYEVGHRQLLLRSVPGAGASTQLDVLFKNVTAIKLPTLLEGLRIEQVPDVAARTAIRDVRATQEPGQHVFTVDGANYVGYVVGGIVVTDEWSGDYLDESRLLSGQWEGPIALGSS